MDYAKYKRGLGERLRKRDIVNKRRHPDARRMMLELGLAKVVMIMCITLMFVMIIFLPLIMDLIGLFSIVFCGVCSYVLTNLYVFYSNVCCRIETSMLYRKLYGTVVGSKELDNE